MMRHIRFLVLFMVGLVWAVSSIAQTSLFTPVWHCTNLVGSIPAANAFCSLTFNAPIWGNTNATLIPVPVNGMTDSNGVVSFPSTASGYSYVFEIDVRSANPYQPITRVKVTNGFPVGLTGTIAAEPYDGIQFPGNVPFAYFNTNQPSASLSPLATDINAASHSITNATTVQAPNLIGSATSATNLLGTLSASKITGTVSSASNLIQNLVPSGAVYTADSNPNFPGFYDYYLTVTPNVPLYVVITNTAAGNAAWDPNNFNILLTSGYITPTGNQILLQNGINTSVPVEERVYTSNVWNQFVVGTLQGDVQNATVSGSSFYNNTSHSLPLVYTNTQCKLSATNGNNWFYCTSGTLTPDFVKGLSFFPSNTPTAQYFVTAVVSNKWVYVIPKVGGNYTNQYPIMNPVEWTHYDTTDSTSDDAQGIVDSAGNPWATANDITSGYFLTDFGNPTTNGWTWTTDVHINGEHYMAFKSHFTGFTVVAVSPSAPYESLDVRADGGITTRGGAIIFMPVRTSGPTYCTNGASAYWNSNGIATYLRTSLAGQTTWTDHLQQAH